jgi:hypothetical protein
MSVPRQVFYKKKKKKKKKMRIFPLSLNPCLNSLEILEGLLQDRRRIGPLNRHSVIVGTRHTLESLVRAAFREGKTNHHHHLNNLDDSEKPLFALVGLPLSLNLDGSLETTKMNASDRFAPVALNDDGHSRKLGVTSLFHHEQSLRILDEHLGLSEAKLFLGKFVVLQKKKKRVYKNETPVGRLKQTLRISSQPARAFPLH